MSTHPVPEDSGSPKGQLNTFPAMFMEAVRRYGDKRAFFQEKEYGIWQSYGWGESLENVRTLAAGLSTLGLKRGDKVCIVGDNRPHLYWGMLATQALGGVPVPLYQDSIEKEMAFIVDHAEARFVLVEDQEQADKMLSIKDTCPRLEWVIYKDPRGLRNYQETYLLSYAAVQEAGRELLKRTPGFFEDQVARGRSDELAVICYTSGTTGVPKGVMLCHGNFILSSHELQKYEALGNESIMAYLPMAWVGDFFLSLGLAIVGGYTVNCPESGSTVMQDLKEIGPTIFFGPPRIWENLLTTVMIRMEDASWIKRRMFHYFIGHAMRMQKKINRHQKTGLGERLLYQLGRLLVYGPLTDRLGLNRLKLAYTAGEAMGPDTFDFFRSLGINLKQIYAMTEAGIFMAVPMNGDVRSDTNGPPVPWIDLKISPSGEVLIRGPGMFTGYLKNEEATQGAFQDGYFKTGDAGFLDKDGHLVIIDRVKDVSHLQDGTMFAPKFLENKLKFSPYIKEAVAIGQARPFVTAMLNIDLEAVGSWAERRNIAFTGYTDLAQKSQVYELVLAEVNKVNASLAEEERTQGTTIRRFLILHKELDPDDEEITRTRKVRRGFIGEKYKALIEALYSDATNVSTEAKVTFEDGRTAMVKANLEIRNTAADTGAREGA
ncbi:MAG: AMP-binding protein [Deltaproteobacteria bacterium]|nr:AMP-binding protein [Deltaproteobacteria bacterium]